MQFIKNGPDIPERLLQEHEDGKIVLFCGAGVSYPAKLPGFGGLVDKLYASLGEIPSFVECAAIKKEQYDTAIGLLERRLVDGRAVVREQLAKILTPDLSEPQVTATQEALLSLARNRKGQYRLITTNFDRLFEEVIANRSLRLQTFQAPMLPVPKNRWDGLVYLHGLLPETPTGSDLDHLVVSSGDFGLAYLKERWAARFVSELFRTYTVCFVGYSINDPVLRYMIDALAADRLLGESPPEAFAFGSHPKGKEGEKTNEWCAKNVTPILYKEYRQHAYLHRTLRAWADIYRDGALGKERIIVQHAMNRPLASTKQDDFVGRVLWALSDQHALPAKRFAELDPPPPIDWLEPLSENRFHHGDLKRFGVHPDTKEDDSLAFGLVLRPTPYKRAPWMSLVHRTHAGDTQWDDVMFQLARWLLRHLNNPKLILWVASHGGTLHTQFVPLIDRAIQDHPPSPPMRTLWRIALSGRLQTHPSRRDLFGWRKSFKREGLTPSLRQRLRDLLTPNVRLRGRFRGDAADDLKAETEPYQLKDIVDWEIVLRTDHVHFAMKEMSRNAQWIEALPDLLSDATSLLRDTLDLMHELGGADDQQDGSHRHQPSISDHPQNRRFRDWTALIDLAREAWKASAARFPGRARLEAQRWFSIPYPLFRRLTFFALTDINLFTPQEAIGSLLADRHWWLWSVETERETLRLLVSIAPRLDAQDGETLERAILRGPPREMFRDSIDQDRLQQRIDWETWLRLAKCRAAGAQLGPDAAAKLQALAQQYPAWRLATDERDEFPVWMGDSEEWRTFLSSPKNCRDLVVWLREHPTVDTWQEDDWRERSKKDFRRTTAALLHLANRGEWLVERWRQALQAWSDETFATRSWRCLCSSLTIAPDEVIKELASPIGWWLQSISKTFSVNEDAFFILIRRVLALHREETAEPHDDPVFKAINHPVGYVTEAALRWWYRKPLEDDEGLADILKPIFTDLCDIRVSSFRHGRVLLSRNVIALFRVDGQWARLHLLPQFDWQRSVTEARAVWEGFLWSPRIYRPLMEAIKPQFLTTAQRYANLGEYAEQYAALLTFVGLEPSDIFSRAELVAATRSLPAEGLERAAETLVSALSGAGEQRAEYWRNRILPYIKYIWPKSRDVITSAISESFARLCVTAKDAFPSAFEELKRWLRPLDDSDFVVHLLHEQKLCESFPDESLKFLDAVIGGIAQWPPEDLKACLDAIRGANPGLEPDPRLQRLREYLRRYERS
jgi:hypothetical protein